jgi:hypothetical protein
MMRARRANVSAEAEQNVELLLTLDKLYLLDCHSNTLQQHFRVEHTQLLKRQDTSAHRNSELAEIHLIPHSKSATKIESSSDALSPSSFPTVEYYLKLSQIEAQKTELPIATAAAASPGYTDEDDSSNPQAVASQSDAEKCETSLNTIVLLVGELEATRFLSVYQSMRSHILEPELNFCVYSSAMAAEAGEREESFFSASSRPTL